MFRVQKSFWAFLLGVAVMTSASADLIGRTPYAGGSFGQQSDASSAPFVEGFTAPANKVLEAIRWWGFHSVDSGGASFDDFIVTNLKRPAERVSI